MIDGEEISNKYGILDFADISCSPYLFDLAIAMSYFMMSHPEHDFLFAASHFVAGYISLKRLTAMEEKLLFITVCAAYCREVVLATDAYVQQGRNNKYLLTALEPG